jgi:hypothetical protein
MKQIETEPERHFQGAFYRPGNWVCQTAYCLAGWGAIQGGVTPPTSTAWWIDSVTLESHDDAGRGRQYVSHWAKEYFGLTNDQAAALFHANNSAAELREMVDLLTVNPDNTLDRYLVTIRPFGTCPPDD